jgi:hypothetical protein
MEQQHIPADPHVTAYQVAARIYCAMIGANPDQPVQLPHPQLAGVSMGVPFWYTVAERMLDLSLLMRSIKAQADQQRAANDGKVPATEGGTHSA